MTVEPPPLPELVSFLESLPEPHILCDRSYRILAANAAYRANCGRPDDLIGRKCFEVSHRYPVPCDQAGESCPLAHSLKSGQRERVVHLHHTSAGESYENIELSPIRGHDGEIAYFIEKLEPLPVARGLAHAQGLIGRAPAFRAMLELVARVAPSDATVLLQGESGTGKELVAQAIHDASRRAKGPFVAVDCSGLTETLFESEIFGHERGAFTGATTRKIGLVEAARGGTLFLDEMGDIPLTMQVKLLRLLETGTYRRVGSTELMRSDIRLISATHRPLKALVEKGQFRQDLFYRVNAFPIALPPLRQRREDIPLLVDHFLSGYARQSQSSIKEVDKYAAKLLHDYSWPGNVGELQNAIERACSFADDKRIRPVDLPPKITQKVEITDDENERMKHSLPIGTKLADFIKKQERMFIRETLKYNEGSREKTASMLGVSIATLYRKMGLKLERDKMLG